MQELPLTWTRLAKIFWAWLWRATVLAAFVGAVAGGIAGTLFGHSGVQTVITFGQVAWIPLSFISLRMALQKTYRDFRLAVAISEENEVPATAKL